MPGASSHFPFGSRAFIGSFTCWPPMSSPGVHVYVHAFKRVVIGCVFDGPSASLLYMSLPGARVCMSVCVQSCAYRCLCVSVQVCARMCVCVSACVCVHV